MNCLRRAKIQAVAERLTDQVGVKDLLAITG